MDPRLQRLVAGEPGWLLATGPCSEVVVASRVRLARNVAGIPFPQQIHRDRADDLAATAGDCLRRLTGEGEVLEPRSLSHTDAEFIIERSLATRDLMQADRPTLCYFSSDGRRGVMVNEEDHFRIQGFAPGLDFDSAMASAQAMERCLRKGFEFAVHERYGYLTSCPTNTGSGLRASVMVHLPALARAKVPMQRALHTARSASLAVRGVHGEGSRALGHLYQISNQRTLGRSAQDQMDSVAEFAREVTRYEAQTRESFQQKADLRKNIVEDLEAALKLLREATGLTTAQALDALGMLRMGALMNLTDSIGFAASPEHLLRLCFKLQPGHLQARTGQEMTPEQRDLARANFLRVELGFAS